MKTNESLDRQIERARADLEASLGCGDSLLILQKSQALDILLEKYLDQMEDSTTSHHKT